MNLRMILKTCFYFHVIYFWWIVLEVRLNVVFPFISFLFTLFSDHFSLLYLAHTGRHVRVGVRAYVRACVVIFHNESLTRSGISFDFSCCFLVWTRASVESLYCRCVVVFVVGVKQTRIGLSCKNFRRNVCGCGTVRTIHSLTHSLNPPQRNNNFHYIESGNNMRYLVKYRNYLLMMMMW